MDALTAGKGPQIPPRPRASLQHWWSLPFGFASCSGSPNTANAQFRVLLPAAPRRPQHEHDPPVHSHRREDLFFQGHRLPLGCTKQSISPDDHGSLSAGKASVKGGEVGIALNTSSTATSQNTYSTQS